MIFGDFQAKILSRRVTLRYSRVTFRYSRVTLRYSRVTLRYSRVTLRYSRVTLRNSLSEAPFARVLRNQTGGHLPCGCILVL